MKRIICILLIALICLFPGCDQETDGNQETFPPELDEEISNIDIYEPDLGTIKIYYPTFVYNPPDAILKTWRNHMLDKYEVDIEMHYTTSHMTIDVLEKGAPHYGADIDELRKVSQDSGLVFINSGYDFTTLVRNGILIPLNDYLDDIPKAAELNSGLLDIFKDDDGNLLAIPLSNYLGADSRGYNKKWIDKWGNGIPSDIDEFMEFGEFVRDKDPDGNDEADSYLLTYSIDGFLFEMEDVLRAFGCFCGRDPIGYNPMTEKYENVVFNENFDEALMYIKLLKDSGIIVEADFQFYERGYLNYNVGSSHFWSGYDEFRGDPAVAGFGLEGINADKIIRAYAAPMCIGVMKNTKDISLKINALLDILYNNQDGFIDFYRGSTEAEEDTKDYYAIPDYPWFGMIGIYTEIWTEKSSSKPFVRMEDEITPERINEQLQWYINERETIQMFSENYNDDIAYFIKLSKYPPELEILNHKVKSLTDNLIRAVLDGTKTYEEMIDGYRQKLDMMGITAAVDALNSN